MSHSPTSSRWSVLDPRTRAGQIYLGLLLLRCCSAFLGYGYIHPDEWMQSGEAYFGVASPDKYSQLPWEWQPDKALRSLYALVQLNMPASGLLFLSNKLVSVSVSGLVLFLVQRAGMLLWTLCLDAAIVLTFPAQTARYVLCLNGISTATTTFMVRPFSNSHEALLLQFCFLWTLASYRKPIEQTRGKLASLPFVPAVLVVHGFLARFTFAIFALPLALFIAYMSMHVARGGSSSSMLGALAVGMVGIVSLYQCAKIDTNFYTRLAKASGTKVASVWGTRWVLAPINALMYNVKTDNVAQHGLHPRWLHVVVNLPMVVGIANCGVVVFYGWHFVQSFVTASTSGRPLHGSSSISADTRPMMQAATMAQHDKQDECKARVQSIHVAATTNQVDVEHVHVDIEPIAVGLSLSTIVLSLAMLSISPHQEPRFVLALAFPSTLVMAYALQSRPLTQRPRLVRLVVMLHVIQHMLQLILFSFLHQAALLPVLFSIDRSFSISQQPQYHIVYRTFPVPLHLVPHKSTHHHVEYHDSSLEPMDVVQIASRTCNHMYTTSIYAPSWVVDQLINAVQQVEAVELVKVQSFYWHLDMDHLVESWTLAVKQGSFKDAFAIHKLQVYCTTRSHQTTTWDQQPSQSQDIQNVTTHLEL